MKSYLSVVVLNSDALTKSDSEGEFSSYLDSHQKVDSSLSSEAEADNNENVLTSKFHQMWRQVELKLKLLLMMASPKNYDSHS